MDLVDREVERVRKTFPLYWIACLMLLVIAAQAQTALTITPATATLPSGGTQQFKALSGQWDMTLTAIWSASAGTISATGLWQAPAVTTNTVVTIKATLNSTVATATVTVTPATPTVVVTVSPATASVVSARTQQFT